MPPGHAAMESASTKALLAKFEDLQVWRAGDQRAPHKPLLALWAIGRCLAGEPRLAPFAEADRGLTALLRDFGPHRARVHTEHPFWRLRNDGLWEVEDADLVTTTSKGDAHRRSLLEHNNHAGFPESIHEALSSDENLAKQIAHALVDAHFPASLHAEILKSAGIEPAYVTTRRMPRDPRFPELVLEAYGHRCAVCGFAVRLNEKPSDLKPRTSSGTGRAGPTSWRTRSRSARFTIASSTRAPSRSGPSRRIVVTAQATGAGHEEALGRFHARPIALPSSPGDAPDTVFSAWHTREVFVPPGYLILEKQSAC